MLFLYLNLLIFCSSFDVTRQVKSSSIRCTWNNTKYLTRSNWTSSLMSNLDSTNQSRPVWFIFHYLNYCGSCRRVAPTWETIGQYGSNWSKYIQIASYDCASESESNTDICQDEQYPSWRIFCPLTNSTYSAFPSQQRRKTTTPEEILMWFLEKLNCMARECFGPSWPAQEAIDPKNIDDLAKIIPSSVKRFRLFVGDDVLRYILYVLNHSFNIDDEPIYRLTTHNELNQSEGVWQGIRNGTDQISLELTTEIDSVPNLVLNRSEILSSETTNGSKNATSIRPTASDIDSAVVWMLNRDLRRKFPSFTVEVKNWLQTLQTYYSGSDIVRDFLRDLIEFIGNRTTLSSTEFQLYLNSTSVKKIRLPEIKFDHCQGSDIGKRGYPCSLWVLFHSMTVKQSSLAEQNQLPTNVKPSDLIVSIRGFITRFFLCEECATHFANMTFNAENEIETFHQTVLYLWRAHNQVNERLRCESVTNDPAWPKLPFPSRSQCSTCVRQIAINGDAIEYDEKAVYDYFLEFYSLIN